MDPASLIPKGSHNADLADLLSGEVTFEMVSFIAARAAHLLKVDEPEEHRNPLPSPPISPLPTTTSSKGARFTQQQQSGTKPSSSPMPSLESFIIGLCQGSRVQPATLLATLVYLDRLSTKLPRHARGMPCTRHRVFLAALIIAAKYLNDSSPKNKHWASYARVFDKEEINLMEKQLVFLLDFHLRFDEAEAIQHFRPFMRGGEFHQHAPVRTKEETHKLVTAMAAGRPVDVPKAPITPPAEKTVSLAVQQQQIHSLSSSRSKSQRLASASTSSSSALRSSTPVRPPRPAGSLYPLSSSDSLASMTDLTDDNGTSFATSGSSGESGSDGETTNRPGRFALRPVPTERRRNVSNTTAPKIITTSASVDAISEVKPIRVVLKTQRAPPAKPNAMDAHSMPTAVSVPSFFGRVFGKQSAGPRDEPRIHVPAGNALPGAQRYREPVSQETIYDPELL